MNQEQARALLIDHSRSERNGIFPLVVTTASKITNPICGDHVELKLHSDGKIIQDIGFKSRACAICSASSSILCQEARGLTLFELQKLSEDFESVLLAKSDRPWPETLKNFSCFEHLRVNPARKACALLPWVALKSALKSLPTSDQ